MLFFKSATVAIVTLLLAVPAVAQPGPRQDMVRVQNNINFFIAGSTGEGDEAQKLRDKAQRTVYEMAAHEGDLLRDDPATYCRMESGSVNINATNARQFGQQQQEGLNVSGSMSLQITLK